MQLAFDHPDRHFARLGWSVCGPERRITEEEVRAFADLTGNHQWIHEDAERSRRESPYGGIIAHGLFLVSLIPSLLPDEELPTGASVRIIRGLDQVRLPSPVYPGDRVHARVRYVRSYAAPSGKGVVVERAVQVWSATGKKPAAACVLKMQYF